MLVPPVLPAARARPKQFLRYRKLRRKRSPGCVLSRANYRRRRSSVLRTRCPGMERSLQGGVPPSGSSLRPELPALSAGLKTPHPPRGSRLMFSALLPASSCGQYRCCKLCSSSVLRLKLSKPGSRLTTTCCAKRFCCTRGKSLSPRQTCTPVPLRLAVYGMRAWRLSSLTRSSVASTTTNSRVASQPWVGMATVRCAFSWALPHACSMSISCDAPHVISMRMYSLEYKDHDSYW